MYRKIKPKVSEKCSLVHSSCMVGWVDMSKETNGLTSLNKIVFNFLLLLFIFWIILFFSQQILFTAHRTFNLNYIPYIWEHKNRFKWLLHLRVLTDSLPQATGTTNYICFRSILSHSLPPACGKAHPVTSLKTKSLWKSHFRFLR
jgi:hypothetical protein